MDIGCLSNELYCEYRASSIMECYNFTVINRVSLIKIAQKQGGYPGISIYSCKISGKRGTQKVYIYEICA